MSDQKENPRFAAKNVSAVTGKCRKRISKSANQHVQGQKPRDVLLAFRGTSDSKPMGTLDCFMMEKAMIAESRQDISVSRTDTGSELRFSGNIETSELSIDLV